MLTDLLGTTLPRLVAPLFSDIMWRGQAHTVEGDRCLYLTFDDGPHPQSTPLLLNYLNKAEAHATFFFSGSQAEQFPDLVRATAQAGHGVGNHGWAHRNAWSVPKKETIDDFERAEVLLDELTGQPVRSVRPPFGRFTPALRQWCKESERLLVLWDLMPGDFLSPDSSEDELVKRVAGRIVDKARPGSIIVLHESARSQRIVPPALDVALPLLRADGWIVASL